MELRLFAALNVPMEHAERLADHADGIASELGAGRAVDATTMHVTWAFLGAVAEEYVPAVAKALDSAASEVPGATLCTSSSLASFGSGRVLAVDVEVELYASLGAARDHFLESATPYAPHADRRAWRPHVTILRTGHGSRLRRSEVAGAAHPAPASWVAPELRLYASLPGPAGNQHRLLHAAAFGSPIGSR